MKIDREGIRAWSEIIKIILSIVAVVVGAYWALFLYTKKDKPTLEPRFKSSYQLNWQHLGDKCRAVVRVNLENTGVASYRIDRVVVQAWNFERVDEKVGDVDYFELNKVKQDRDRFFNRTYGQGEITLVRQYPPQTGTGHTFEWTFTRQDKRWVYFNVDFYKPGDEVPETYVGTWDKMCGDSTAAAPNPWTTPPPGALVNPRPDTTLY